MAEPRPGKQTSLQQLPTCPAARRDQSIRTPWCLFEDTVSQSCPCTGQASRPGCGPRALCCKQSSWGHCCKLSSVVTDLLLVCQPQHLRDQMLTWNRMISTAAPLPCHALYMS